MRRASRLQARRSPKVAVLHRTCVKYIFESLAPFGTPFLGRKYKIDVQKRVRAHMRACESFRVRGKRFTCDDAIKSNDKLHITRGVTRRFLRSTLPWRFDHTAIISRIPVWRVEERSWASGIANTDWIISKTLTLLLQFYQVSSC